MKKSILWIFIGVLGVSIFLPFIFQYFYPNYSFNLKGGCFMWPGHLWMGGMWIFPLIVLVVILLFIYSVFEHATDRTPAWGSDRNMTADRNSHTAFEILKKRYAKGEITKEEFEQMKSDLLN